MHLWHNDQLNMAISLKDATLGNHVHIKIHHKDFRDKTKLNSVRVTYS